MCYDKKITPLKDQCIHHEKNLTFGIRFMPLKSTCFVILLVSVEETFTHTIHKIGIFTYIDPIKINYSWR